MSTKLNNVTTRPPHVDCMLCAFATLMSYSYEEAVAALGTTGLEIVEPDRKGNDPFRYKGVLVQEIVRWGLLNNVSFAHYEWNTAIEDEDGDIIWQRCDDPKYLTQMLATHSGIVLGSNNNGRPHAVAWDHWGNVILDPIGFVYPWGHEKFFVPESFLALSVIQ